MTFIEQGEFDFCSDRSADSMMENDLSYDTNKSTETDEKKKVFSKAHDATERDLYKMQDPVNRREARC